MIHLKNKFEVEKMYVAGQIVKETLFLIEDNIKEGITTIDEVLRATVEEN